DRDGKRFVLDLRAATPARPEFGGLTDPRGHAPDVLPVMWRARSALAGEGTSLTVGGRPYDLAVDPATGGMAAYWTEGFGMGVLAAAAPAVARPASDRVAVETLEGPRAREIRVRSSGETPSTLVLTFNPFLPDSGEVRARETRFAIAIDDQAE